MVEINSQAPKDIQWSRFWKTVLRFIKGTIGKSWQGKIKGICLFFFIFSLIGSFRFNGWDFSQVPLPVISTIGSFFPQLFLSPTQLLPPQALAGFYCFFSFFFQVEFFASSSSSLHRPIYSSTHTIIIFPFNSYLHLNKFSPPISIETTLSPLHSPFH